MKDDDVVKKNQFLPPEKYRNMLQCFIKNDIESFAKDSHYLCGTYRVSFSKLIENFTEKKGEIKSGLLSYIRETQNLSNEPLRVIYENGREKCVIEKTDGRDDKVCMGIYLIGSKWESEIYSEVYQLLDERIGEKKHKLRYISYPKILLLHDQYLFAYSQKYKSCISSIPSRFSFHAILLVENKSKSFLLFSQDPKWESKL